MLYDPQFGPPEDLAHLEKYKREWALKFPHLVEMAETCRPEKWSWETSAPGTALVAKTVSQSHFRSQRLQ